MSHRGKDPGKGVHENSSICKLEQRSVSLDQLKDFADDFESQVYEPFHLEVRLLTEEQISQLRQESVCAFCELLE